MKLYDKLKKYFKEVFSGPDYSIYHYTKKGVGNNIINSGYFKLTSHQELNKKNDNGELIVGPSITREYLKKTNLSKWERIFNDFIKKGIMFHVGSFCEDANNLHAIKEYGSDCLEFKAEYLSRIQTQPSLLIGRVIYDDKKQTEIISTIFGLYEETKNEDQTESRCSLFYWLTTAFPLLKKEKHHLDAECRIITVNGYDPHKPTEPIGKIQNKIEFILNEVIFKSK